MLCTISVGFAGKLGRIYGSKGEVFCVALEKQCDLDAGPLSKGEVFCVTNGWSAVRLEACTLVLLECREVRQMGTAADPRIARLA